MKQMIIPFKIQHFQNLTAPLVIHELPDPLDNSAINSEDTGNMYKVAFTVVLFIAGGLFIAVVCQRRRINQLMQALSKTKENPVAIGDASKKSGMQ